MTALEATDPDRAAEIRKTFEDDANGPSAAKKRTSRAKAKVAPAAGEVDEDAIAALHDMAMALEHCKSLVRPEKLNEEHVSLCKRM